MGTPLDDTQGKSNLIPTLDILNDKREGGESWKVLLVS